VDSAQPCHLAGNVPLLTGTHATSTVERPRRSRQNAHTIVRIQRLKHAIKVCVAHVLYYTGVLSVLQAITLRHKAVVLMYHRVLDQQQREVSGSHPGIIVSRETFDRQMAFLKRRFVVLSAEEFAGRLEQGLPFQSSSCLITFDDGWIDNFTNALPILARRELPALIFLPVNFIGRRRLFWQEALTHLLLRVVREVRSNPDARDRFRAILSDAQLEFVLDLPDHNPRPAIAEAVGAQKGTALQARERLLGSLTQALDVRADELSTTDAFVDWNQIAAMTRDRIEFGGHGAEHHLLTNIPAVQAKSDIRDSKDVLDARLGRPASTFSYPNGAWNPDLAREVKSTGYRLAFTTEPGYVSCDDDPLTLRRLNIHEDVTSSMPMFLARIVGLF
jgi:peptidoglycan/xylan/chitin deacetylase (PgdA/CDA1 family)